MRIGSLFSGAGGLDMAVEAAFAGHTVWHSEIDKAPPRRRKPVTLGQSPPTVCLCGHHVDDHLGHHGLCQLCLCPLFEPDSDR